MSSTIKKWLLIYLSFFTGGLLMLLRLPPGGFWLSPLWLVLILLYWVLMKPKYINIGAALFVGLILDIVYNTVIGEHALALVAVVFLVTKLHHKIMLFSFWSYQMTLVVLSFLTLYQLFILLVQLYVGEYLNLGVAWGGVIISILIWPLLAWLLFNCQQKLRI